jgi:peptide/nickel transport system permease protein
VLLSFLARRLLLALLVLVGFSFLSFAFFAGRFNPLKGHPVLPTYWRWLRGLPSGHSLTHGLEGPILPTLLPSLAHTLVLLGVTLVLVVVFSLLAGTLAAVSQGSLLDLLLRGSSYLAWGIPAFLLALIVQQTVNTLGGAHGLGPFPIAGWPGSCPTGLGIDAGTITPCPAAGTGLRYLVNVARYVTLPAFALTVGFVGLHSRYLRSSLAASLNSPYITTARAKGLPERQVVLRHALRNSLGTFVAALLTDFGAIFGAAMAVDWIFQLNGLGSLFIREVNPNIPALDAYAVQLLLLLTGALLLAASVLSELAVALLDPRTRLD